VPKVYVQLHNATWPRGGGGETDAAGAFSFRVVAGSDVTLEICRPDANPSNYRTACTQQKRRVTGDVTVDLEMPK